MKLLVSALFLLLVLVDSGSRAQTPVADADKAAIKQTALDYIEGWYEGNAEARSLKESTKHARLNKRIALSRQARRVRPGVAQWAGNTVARISIITARSAMARGQNQPMSDGARLPT